MADLDHVIAFLGCRTPQGWLEQALSHLDILLIDHAHCEKKAASTALNLLFRYVDARVGGIVIAVLVGHTAWHWLLERFEALRAFEI